MYTHMHICVYTYSNNSSNSILLIWPAFIVVLGLSVSSRVFWRLRFWKVRESICMPMACVGVASDKHIVLPQERIRRCLAARFGPLIVSRIWSLGFASSPVCVFDVDVRIREMCCELWCPCI